MNELTMVLTGTGALAAAGASAYTYGRLSARMKAMGRPGSGFPDKHQVRDAFGLELRRTEMPWVRPGLAVTAETPPEQMALYLGRSIPHRIATYTSLEEALAVLGPPRMNKTTGEILEAILTAPGACVVTSLRPDVLLYTAIQRGKGGAPVLCWDGEGIAHWPHGLRWNPLRGCEDHDGALRRAGSLVAGGGATVNEDFWTCGAVTLLRCLLHAAAIDPGATIKDLRKWVSNRSNERPLDILTANPRAIPGYADELRGELSADPRTADGVYRTAARAVACLADPRVVQMCTPPPHEEFDPQAFVTSGGTAYLLCRQKLGGMAPLVTALVDELVEATYRVGAASPGERLDPPCRFVLDECATVGPPNLVEHASYLGGSGGQLVISFQTWAQARKKYTEHGAAALWTNCTTKVILGGIDNEQDLRHISSLLGERDDYVTTSSRGRGGGQVTTTTNVRKVPVMSPAQLREMPKGRQLIIATGRPKLLTELPSLRQRPDWPALADGLDEARKITGRDLEETSP